MTRLRENAKFYEHAKLELDDLLSEQVAAQWSSASPVGEYVATLRAALRQLRASMITMHAAVEGHADALQGTAAQLSARDDSVAESLSAVAARGGYR
ncbi:hypothetical protein [Cellulomonas soli]